MLVHCLSESVRLVRVEMRFFSHLPFSVGVGGVIFYSLDILVNLGFTKVRIFFFCLYLYTFI